MAIVRHKTTNYLYEYKGSDTYRNIITNIEGQVPAEVAQKIFAINLDATVLFNEYPNIERLIKALNLKIETRL